MTLKGMEILIELFDFVPCAVGSFLHIAELCKISLLL